MLKKQFVTVLAALTLCLFSCFLNTAQAAKVLPSTNADRLPYTGDSQQLLSNLGEADDNHHWQYFFYGTKASPMWYFPAKEIPVGTEVDHYYIHCFYVDNDKAGLEDTMRLEPEVTIEVEILPIVSTVPKAKTGLVADGTAQNLLAVYGKASGGRGSNVDYSVTPADENSPAGWKENATATEPGTYKIWYRANAAGPDRSPDASWWFSSKPDYITVTIDEPKYDVATTVSGNGSVSADVQSAVENEVVTLTVSPQGGDVLDNLTVTYGVNQNVTLTPVAGQPNKYRFSMPDSNVTVHASFEHTYANTFSYNGNQHWYAATCSHDVFSGREDHSGGTADCLKQAVCIKCNQPYGALGDHSYGTLVPVQPEIHTQTELKARIAAHYQCGLCKQYFTEDKVQTTLLALTDAPPSHSFGAWIFDEDNHWRACSCGLKTENGEHQYNSNTDSECITCGYWRTLVHFNANGGSGEMLPQRFRDDAGQPLAGNQFSRVGYAFDGWNTAANGSGTDYADGEVATFAESLTLYAQWKAIPYAITITSTEGGTAQAAVHGQPITTAFYGSVVNLDVYAAPGYHFVKWESISGGVHLNAPEDGAVDFSMPANAVEFKAVFEKTAGFSVEIHHDASGNGSGSAGASPSDALEGQLVVLKAISHPGNRFIGWTGLEGLNFQKGNAQSEEAIIVMPARNVTAYAKWELLSYDIHYDLAGGTGTNPATYTVEDEVVLEAPVRTGHTFAGWTGTGLTQPEISVCIHRGSTGNRSYTANWTKNWYTLSFDANGGSPVPSIHTEYNTAIIPPANPTREGYTFAGWEPAIPAVMPLNGLKVKAQWKPVAGGDDSKPDEEVQTKTFVNPSFSDQDIPEELRKKGLDTVRKIEFALKTEITAQNSSMKHTELYDVILMYSVDGGKHWIAADETHFPDDGKLWVELPVPENTSEQTHHYIVKHMFTSSAFGKVPGQTETPDVTVVRKTNGEKVLRFYVTGLSPIMVAWTEKAAQPLPVPTPLPQEPPKTGDASHPAAWLLLMSVSLCGMLVLARKQRKYR